MYSCSTNWALRAWQRWWAQIPPADCPFPSLSLSHSEKKWLFLCFPFRCVYRSVVWRECHHLFHMYPEWPDMRLVFGCDRKLPARLIRPLLVTQKLHVIWKQWAKNTHHHIWNQTKSYCEQFPCTIHQQTSRIGEEFFTEFSVFRVNWEVKLDNEHKTIHKNGKYSQGVVVR